MVSSCTEPNSIPYEYRFCQYVPTSIYLFLSTINGSSTSIAPDVGKLSGSDFHPLNSVIPTPAVELELELVELLDDSDELDELTDSELELDELDEDILNEFDELDDELDSELELVELELSDELDDELDTELELDDELELAGQL